MALVLDGSAGISGVDGTASNPAIEGTDSNTGIFYPAADTWAVATGGTERLRVDSAGNAGLGVTPSAWSFGKALEIGASGNNLWGATQADLYLTSNTYYNGAWKYASNNAVGVGVYEINGGAHYWYRAASGTANANVTLTNSMVLDGNGNLGIGTTTPDCRLDVRGSAIQVTGTISGYGGGEVRLGLTTSGLDNAISTQATGAAIMIFDHRGTSNTGYWLWRNGTGGANERMRLTGDGNLLIGTTSTATTNIGCKLILSDGVGAYQVMGASGTGTYNFHQFYRGTNGSLTYVGQISTTGTATTYATASDYRLKENVQPMTGALAKVATLKPCTYKWKIDGSDGQGFIAHELAEVCPQAVVGEKDAVETYTDEEGNEQTRPAYQGVDTSFLVATLTAAIQELKAELDATKAEVAALKAQP